MPHPIVMPSLGMYTAEGTVTSWLRPAGAEVRSGEAILEVTTDKAAYEIPAPADGVVHWVAELGATLPVQGLIGYVLALGEAQPPDVRQPSGSPGASAPGRTIGTEAPAPSSPPHGRDDVRMARDRAQAPTPGPASAPAGSPPLPALPSEIRASPVARRLALQHGVDLAQVAGSGPGGRIIEADVAAEVARRGAAPEELAGVGRRVLRTVPLAGMRRTIAVRLRQSLEATLPVTLTREVDAEALVAARSGLAREAGGAPPYDAFFVKLLAAALRERPELNAIVEGDTIVILDEVHVGVAVSVPGGLVVPVVRDADRRSLTDVAAAIDGMGRRARANGLRPEEIAGGTATITNLGAHGVDAFTPIINPPQSAILGIGRIQARPAVREGQLVARRTCVLSLTFDHRVADGAPAADLLDAFARLMQDDRYLAELSAQ